MNHSTSRSPLPYFFSRRCCPPMQPIRVLFRVIFSTISAIISVFPSPGKRLKMKKLKLKRNENSSRKKKSVKFLDDFNAFSFGRIHFFQIFNCSYRFVPNDGEIGTRTKILGDCNGFIEIKNNVPPSTRNENRFTRALKYFNGQTVLWPRGQFRAGINNCEPGNSFVALFSTFGSRDFE